MDMTTLQAIDRYLDAPQGSRESMNALADLTEMADDAREAFFALEALRETFRDEEEEPWPAAR